MSKRAEEATIRLYPESSGPMERSIFEDRRVTLACRRACEEGYKQAEKDTIDYACYELELRLPEYLNYNGIQVERDEFIKDFRKAMEEE